MLVKILVHETSDGSESIGAEIPEMPTGWAEITSVDDLLAETEGELDGDIITCEWGNGEGWTSFQIVMDEPAPRPYADAYYQHLAYLEMHAAFERLERGHLFKALVHKHRAHAVLTDVGLPTDMLDNMDFVFARDSRNAIAFCLGQKHGPMQGLPFTNQIHPPRR